MLTTLTRARLSPVGGPTLGGRDSYRVRILRQLEGGSIGTGAAAGLALRLDALDLHAPAGARGLDHRQRDLHDAQPVQAGRGWLAAGGDRALEVLDLGHVVRQQRFRVVGGLVDGVARDLEAARARLPHGVVSGDEPGDPVHAEIVARVWKKAARDHLAERAVRDRKSTR